jgi:transcription initiation factor IIE alpha subunit
MRSNRDPLICECCQSPEALAVAYDLPTGKFVCPACGTRLRRERLQRIERGDGRRTSMRNSEDQG